MTTIAVDPNARAIAADTNVSDGSQKWKCNKIELIDGTYYGAAGDAIDIEKFYEWVREWKRTNRKPRKPRLDVDEFNALSLDPDGNAWWWDNKLHPMRMTEPFAIGSGAMAARAAMRAGVDIERAVEIACEVDAGSALPLTVYRLPEEKK